MLLGSCGSLPTAENAMPTTTIGDVVDDVAEADVVFLGEQHGNPVGNFQELEWLRMLHERRSHVVLSMEFFERDVQTTLDAYIAGEIDEEQFTDEARAPKGYQREHRPLIEYCKKHGIKVVAANAPIDMVRKVSHGKLDSVVGMDFAPRETSAPKDAYWDAFVAAMEGHAGVDEATMMQFYRAQCLRDDAMAESIIEAIDSGGERPLVVHVSGNMHVDDHLGTVARVRSRRPDLRCVVMVMETEPSLVKRADDYYTLIVPPEPPKPKKAESHEDDDDDGAHGDGRPALGFMPNYDSEGGVEIEMLREGGPAEEAGLQDGDLIISVDGAEIADTMGYIEILGSLSVGDTVEVVAMRGDEKKTFQVKVGSRNN